ncbi:MAG: cyclase family protein [Bacteroidia bacterium]|nr:cyclase family protein [Bacteroidia bacterium]
MVYDISRPLDMHTPVYPGDPPFDRTVIHSMREGAGYNLSTLRMSAHIGTHVDAPYHFIDTGLRIDEIPPERWISSAVVVEVSGIPLMDSEHFRNAGLRPGDSVLLKSNTNRAPDAHPDDFHAISTDAARWLVERGVNIIGIDALSIEQYHDPSFPVHQILLGAGVLILEGLHLDDVPAGRYTLFVAPLLITGGDGAPARALLMTE